MAGEEATIRSPANNLFATIFGIFNDAKVIELNLDKRIGFMVRGGGSLMEAWQPMKTDIGLLLVNAL